MAAGLHSELASTPESQGPATGASGFFTAMVVDEHPLVRSALADRLRELGAGEVAEASTLAEARSKAQLGPPRELCVIGLDLPDGSGLTLLAELHGSGWPGLIVLSTSGEGHCVRAAFQAGARGYLLTSTPASTVTEGIRRVLDGGVFTDPAVTTALPPTGVGAVDGTVRELSGREVQVLRLVAHGQSNKEIGHQLGLSALTVKSHLARTARKLGTGDRSEMVALAMRAGAIR